MSYELKKKYSGNTTGNQGGYMQIKAGAMPEDRIESLWRNDQAR
jgi:hypothetical protein